MRRRLPKPVAALAAALWLLPAVAVEAKQKKDGRGIHECQQRIAAKIQADHPPSRGSSFDSTVERGKYGDNAVTIRGRGRVLTAKGKRRAFSYSCVYNHRNGKLSQVRYKIH